MKGIRKSEWIKYKSDFLAANRCTVDEFETDYVAFIKRKPNIFAYRQFATRYGITVIPDRNIPEDLQTVLSVNISAIKVMAKTFEESLAAIQDILSPATKH